MATYADWIKAVDAQLHARKLGIRSSGINGAILTDSFQNGVSPVQFAMQVQQGIISATPPRTTTPILSASNFQPPDYRVLRLLSSTFGGVAWITWLVAIVGFLAVTSFFVYQLFVTLPKDLPGYAFVALGIQIGWSFAVFVTGCIWMLLSQGILLVIEINRRLKNIEAKLP